MVMLCTCTPHDYGRADSTAREPRPRESWGVTPDESLGGSYLRHKSQHRRNRGDDMQQATHLAGLVQLYRVAKIEVVRPELPEAFVHLSEMNTVNLSTERSTCGCAFLQCPIRFASGLFACLLLVALVGTANAEAPTRFEIIGASVLRFGLTEDRRPLSFAEVSGNVEGIDVDTAMSLA
jgi:hypothetical protein